MGVSFEKGEGRLMLTASYDNTIKVWNTTDWRVVKVLVGHEGRIMGADHIPSSHQRAPLHRFRWLRSYAQVLVDTGESRGADGCIGLHVSAIVGNTSEAKRRNRCR